MSQLDKLQKDYDASKSKGSKGMKDAVASTEEIRKWVSLNLIHRTGDSILLRASLSPLTRCYFILLRFELLTILKEEHTWSIEKLAEKMMTDKEKGLSSD